MYNPYANFTGPDYLLDLGYDINNVNDIDILRGDCASGIDWFVYTAWDDHSTSIDTDILGDCIAALLPDLAHTWTGDIM